jgi:hypothetical protein
MAGALTNTYLKQNFIHNFKEIFVSSLGWGLLSFLRIIEELLERKINGSSLENRD